VGFTFQNDELALTTLLQIETEGEVGPALLECIIQLAKKGDRRALDELEGLIGHPELPDWARAMLVAACAPKGVGSPKKIRSSWTEYAVSLVKKYKTDLRAQGKKYRIHPEALELAFNEYDYCRRLWSKFGHDLPKLSRETLENAVRRSHRTKSRTK
jgi:hypothetical protein